MAKGKAKAPAGAAPEKQAQGETYKGWSATKDGPIALNDDLRAKIDEYHTYEPSEAEDIYAALEEAGLVYDGQERNALRNRLSTLESWGWDGKDGVVFTDAEAEEIGAMIATWADADDVAAADLEAVLIQRELTKPKDATEKRAERALDKLGWTFIREQDTKKGKVVELGYHAEKGGQKTATLPTLVEVLAAVRMLEGVAPPPQPAATSAPAAGAASPAAPSATPAASSSGSTPSAGGDAHANASLAANDQIRRDHETLKARVATLEARAAEGPTEATKLHIAEYKRRIETICTGPKGWRDSEADIKAIISMRAQVAAYEEFIDDLESNGVAKELSDAKAALEAHEKKFPMFAPPKPSTPVEATKAKAAEAKDKLDQAVADVAKPAPEKPKSEGAKKLEALLASPPPIQPADLTQETRKKLADYGFKFNGRFSAPVPTRAQVEERLVGYEIAREKKQKHRLTELRDGFAAWGWEFSEKGAGAELEKVAAGA